MRKYLDDKLREIYYNPRDKSESQRQHVRYMLNRSTHMFEYDGLPDTIPAYVLELYLQTNGHVIFADHGGELYIYTGGLGGEPDVYYRPTVYTVANPAQNLSKNFRINKDCILMKNTTLFLSLLPLYNRYAYHLAENELSMLVVDINSRIMGVLSADDDRTAESARKYLSDIEAGKLGVIGESTFFEGLTSQPFGGSGARGAITDLIEYEQYLKASWYNDIGLDANYNMKRESLSMTESQMNDDALLPLVDDMLLCRQESLEMVNEKYGTSITVRKAGAWALAEKQALEDPDDGEKKEEGTGEKKGEDDT